MLDYSPLPDSMKILLQRVMISCSDPILGDTAVYTLILVLAIFHDEDDPYICSLHEQYNTMLRRYLSRRRDTQIAVPYLMGVIQNCLNTLSTLASPFRGV